MWYWFTEWWGRRVVKDSSKAEVENSILLDRLVRDWVTVVGEMGCSQDSSGGRGSELDPGGHVGEGPSHSGGEEGLLSR